MLRLLLALQICCLIAAMAQSGDAQDSQVSPATMPPRNKNGEMVIRPIAPVPTKSVFKFSKLDFKDVDPATKELKIELSYHSEKKPDVAAVRVLCIFYDADTDGELAPTESKLSMEWTTAPIDWRGKEKEILTILYSPPPAGSGKKYFGYTVGLYYKDELQDNQASRPEMLELFPFPSVDGRREKSLDESGRYQSAYRAFQRAEKSFENGDFAKARESIRKAVSAFNELQKDHPDWQPRMVDYRLAIAKLLESKINEK